MSITFKTIVGQFVEFEQEFRLDVHKWGYDCCVIKRPFGNYKTGDIVTWLEFDLRKMQFVTYYTHEIVEGVFDIQLELLELYVNLEFRREQTLTEATQLFDEVE
ncbi:hypothetical protein [Scytonema sp. NUACC26]|uniref:hypothetical protein n=1 Tax=Scytonema sp. NUACC26 TaxID=3140176 RepID=UPI0034DB8E5F